MDLLKRSSPYFPEFSVQGMFLVKRLVAPLDVLNRGSRFGSQRFESPTLRSDLKTQGQQPLELLLSLYYFSLLRWSSKIQIARFDGLAIQVGDRKRTINFLKHKNFLAPTLKPPNPGPQKKGLCASFPGKEHKKGTHISFWGGFWGQTRGSQTGHLWPQKVYRTVSEYCSACVSRVGLSTK